MLAITTSDRTVKIERNGQIVLVTAKSKVSYSYDSARVFLTCHPGMVHISEPFAGGITLDGAPVTPDNIEAQFSNLFSDSIGDINRVLDSINGEVV
ncbi:MAG: hypothetical protein LBR26_13220 [Prevotella sp.]|jgi:hypothetical protein|nr:hypothetical protein [Prevotella sp.]